MTKSQNQAMMQSSMGRRLRFYYLFIFWGIFFFAQFFFEIIFFVQIFFEIFFEKLKKLVRS